MKTIFTILLFFAMFLTFGQGVYKQKTNLMDSLLINNLQDINLTEGIDVDKLLKKQKPFDYSNFVISSKEYSYYHPEISTDNNFLTPGNWDAYYQLDFAEDPFNGVHQIYVMGEPLPSPLTTLICSLGVVAILFYCRKRKQIKI